ncbi:unnamed protein product [Prunus armeniaca]
MATRRASCEKWKHAIGPRIFGILEKTKKESAWCIPKLDGESLYEVKNHDGSQIVVDLHACAAIGQLNGDHIAYVDTYYKKEAFMRAYSPMVHPMTSEDLWPKCHRPPLMPLFYHKQPGRPRKKRMRSACEQPSKSNPTATKLQRYNLETKCSLCRREDHNRSSCPKAKEGSSSQVPYKRKVKKSAQYTTSTKRVTRQSTAKQPAKLPQPQHLKLPHLQKLPKHLKVAKLQKLPKKKKRFKFPAKRIKFPKKKDSSQTLQDSQSVQGTESVQAFPVSQTSQSSQPAQSSQPSAISSHPFASGPSKKRFKSPAKRKKFINQKDLLDGYQPWRL